MEAQTLRKELNSEQENRKDSKFPPQESEDLWKSELSMATQEGHLKIPALQIAKASVFRESNHAKAAAQERSEALSELSKVKTLFEERDVEVDALRRALGS